MLNVYLFQQKRLVSCITYKRAHNSNTMKRDFRFKPTQDQEISWLFWFLHTSEFYVATTFLTKEDLKRISSAIMKKNDENQIFSFLYCIAVDKHLTYMISMLFRSWASTSFFGAFPLLSLPVVNWMVGPVFSEVIRRITNIMAVRFYSKEVEFYDQKLMQSNQLEKRKVFGLYIFFEYFLDYLFLLASLSAIRMSELWISHTIWLCFLCFYVAIGLYSVSIHVGGRKVTSEIHPISEQKQELNRPFHESCRDSLPMDNLMVGTSSPADMTDGASNSTHPGMDRSPRSMDNGDTPACDDYSEESDEMNPEIPMSKVEWNYYHPNQEYPQIHQNMYSKLSLEQKNLYDSTENLVQERFLALASKILSNDSPIDLIQAFPVVLVNNMKCMLVKEEIVKLDFKLKVDFIENLSFALTDTFQDNRIDVQKNREDGKIKVSIDMKGILSYTTFNLSVKLNRVEQTYSFVFVAENIL
jgi:hypothetical protein